MLQLAMKLCPLWIVLQDITRFRWPKNQDATTFRTPKGVFCYKVMPFDLKNVGATYQRAMQTIFKDMLHKTVECYMDDLVVKSKKRLDLL